MQQNKTHIMYGFVTGIAMIVVNALLYVTKNNMNAGLKWLSFVVFLIGIILNAMAFSKANDGNVTFGQVFGSCFRATAIIALVSVAWGFISLYVFPHMMDDALEQARAEMEKQGKLTDEQMEKALDITRRFFKPFMVAGALFGTLFAGAIFSLIGAAVAKKNPLPAPPAP